MSEAAAVKTAAQDVSSAPAAVGAPAAHRPVLGRSALLIHALALVAFGLTFLMTWVLGAQASEIHVIQAVGGAAALSLALWSVTLALRAFAHAEPKRWPLATLVLFLLEFGALGAWQWIAVVHWGGATDGLTYWGLWIALPVWGCILLGASLLAAPLAWLRTRMAERTALRRGAERWEPIRRRRYGLKWYAGYVTALGLFVLPPIFYFFCTQVSGMAKGSTWQQEIVRHTPAALKRVTDGLCELLDRGPRGNACRIGMLLGGELPPDRLRAYLDDPARSVRNYASTVIAHNHPEAALAAALLAPDGQSLFYSDMQAWAGRLLGSLGSEEIVRTLLKKLPELPRDFRSGLLEGIRTKYRSEFFRDLLPWTKRTFIFSQVFETVFDICFDNEERKALWKQFFSHPDVPFRLYLVRHLSFYRQADLLLDTLRDPEPRVRRNAMNVSLHPWSDLPPDQNRVLVKGLLSLLDDPDLVIRRGSAYLLQDRFIKGTYLPITPSFLDPAMAGEDVLEGAAPAPETPAERAELETVRAAAQKWLDENPDPLKE